MEGFLQTEFGPNPNSFGSNPNLGMDLEFQPIANYYYLYKKITLIILNGKKKNTFPCFPNIVFQDKSNKLKMIIMRKIL